MLDKPTLEFIAEAIVELDQPQLLNHTRYGQRRIITIKGGKVSGPKINGKILPGGADWQTVRVDGTVDISARYSIQTDNGEILYLQDHGIRTVIEKENDKKTIMRTVAVIEADSKGAYDWLNRCLLISAGRREKDHVIIDFYKVC